MNSEQGMDNSEVFQEIPGWTPEELGNFFAEDLGKEVLENAQKINEYMSRLMRIIHEYKTADKLLYSNPSDYYWTPETKYASLHKRTSLVNLTGLLFKNSPPPRFLSPNEQVYFFGHNIIPLWKFVYDEDIGGKVEGLSGIFLSKGEYINTIYLLENVLKDKNLNPAEVEVTKEFVKPNKPRYDFVY